MDNQNKQLNRRTFIKQSTGGAALLAAASTFPTIVPASVFGKNAPSNRIHIGQIGFGRIAKSHDLPEILKHDYVRIVAVAEQISGKNPNGVRFEGTEGWIFVSRGNVGVTATDPGAADGKENEAFKASDNRILQSVIGDNETKLYDSPEQHQNWLECIRNGKQTISHVEIAHRSGSACLIAHTAMKLGRKLRWDAKKERFIGDDEANALLSRPQRFPYGTSYVEG